MTRNPAIESERVGGRRYRIASSILIAAALAFSTFTGSTKAGDHFEAVDAGNLLATAQVVSENVDRIYGRLTPLGDIDLYRLEFGEAGIASVFITVQPELGFLFDTDVTIFDSGGHPLGVYDWHEFTFPVTPGAYYFGIADWDIAALDAFGNIIADDYLEILNPSAVLAGWKVNSSPIRGGQYDISFSIATVPEPSSSLLLSVSVAVLVMRHRRRY